MILSKLIEMVRSEEAPDGDLWLFITGEAASLTINTDCELADVLVDEETWREIPPAGFEERGLSSTIDYQTLVDCIRWADRLADGHDPTACCEVIRYYIRFDAWPETLGAPDPPPIEEIVARLDREFYDSLGRERANTECRRPGCSRGTVEFSALCRTHHFESVKNKPCPFGDYTPEA